MPIWICPCSTAGNASPAVTNNTAATMRRNPIAPPFRLLPLIRRLENLDECLVDRTSHRTLNPQNDNTSRVKGSLGRAAIWAPAPGQGRRGSPRSALPQGGPVPGISSSRRIRRGGHNRPCPHYHLLGVNVDTPLPAGSEARGEMRASRMRVPPGPPLEGPAKGRAQPRFDERPSGVEAG